jgi:stage II sporulation protein D
MKKTLKATALLLAAAILLAAPPATGAGAFTPSVTTMKIGLNYGSSALQSANLQNVTGYGSGYDFGYFDNSRNFIPVGAYTDTVKISVIRDRNMRFDGSGYVEGTSGNAVVGCFHIRLDAPYQSYADASAASYGYAGSFVKYAGGVFYVCVGEYISASAAGDDMAARGIYGATVDSGTTYTVTVVETGTDRIIFEFDGGSASWLGVMPRPSGGTKPQTWFKGYRYNGGFQYARRDGGDITVVNFVNIEDYTRGVVPYEMPNTWPLEALKAQALCARTFAISHLNAHSSSGFDLCTTEHCQVYNGQGSVNEVTEAAVEQTSGQYVTYNGQLCETFFSSSNGGASENSENVWNAALPYLRGVLDPYEADVASRISNYNWTVTYTPDQITQRLRGRGYSCGRIVGMAVTRYTELGNAREVTLLDDAGRTWRFTNGDSIRSALGARSIRLVIGDTSAPAPSGTDASGGIYVNGQDDTLSGSSSPYYAVGGDGVPSQVASPNGLYAITGGKEVLPVTGGSVGGSGEGAVAGTPGAVSSVSSGSGLVNGVFTIRGTGTGHNVGMSQWGAHSMAQYHNKTYDEIINFYFTGVTIG